MKNVKMLCAFILALVLGTDSAYGQFEKQEAKKPGNYWEEIQETRHTFGTASEMLRTKEQLDFLNICWKAREAGVINFASGSFGDTLVLRAAWPGPFNSKEGRRDGQVTCYETWVWAYFAHLDAANAYYKASSKVSKNVQAQVRDAVFKAMSREQILLNHEEAVKHAIPTEVGGTGDFLEYLKVFRESMQPGSDARDARYWKSTFDSLAKPGVAVRRVLGFERMGNGALLINGDPNSDESLKKDEFLFLRRLSGKIRQDILNPSKELQLGLPRFTYWKRDADPNEPALVIRVLQWASPERKLMCSWGTCSPISLHSSLSVSLLKGFCPEWRKALDSFEGSPSQDGISAELMCKAEQDAYRKYFARERRRWNGSTLEEYNGVKAEQEKWLSSNSSSSFTQKLRLCNVAEWIYNQPHNLDCDGAVATLESLERGEVGRDQFLVPADTIPGCRLRGLVAVTKAPAGNLVVLNLGTPEQP